MVPLKKKLNNHVHIRHTLQSWITINLCIYIYDICIYHMRVVSDIRVALDVGHVSLLLLLDMSAAFDTVDHDILIARLDKTFEVRQTPLQWFRTYLSGRSQTILSSSSCNAKQLIQLGVRQGSVLGPILFSLYVSDIAGIVAAHGLSSHQYADDTQIYSHCCPEGVPGLVCRVSTCFREIVSCHLIVYDSTLTKQRQYGLGLQPDAATLAPQHFN